QAEPDREEREPVQAEQKRLALLRAEVKADDRHGDGEESRGNGGHHPAALDPRQCEETCGDGDGGTEASHRGDLEGEAEPPGGVREDKEARGDRDVAEGGAVDPARAASPVRVERDRAGTERAGEGPEERT